jgi:hypothetical protein
VGPVGHPDLTYTATALDKGDGPVTPVCAPASPATFPLGTTLVTCRATDKAGHRATKSFRVTVNGLPPTLDLYDPPAYHADDQLGARVTYPTFHAKDTAGNSLDAGIHCTPESGTWFPMGDTEVSCSVMDADLRETHGTFHVRVADLDAPAVTVPGTLTAEAASSNGAPVSFAVSAFDLVDGICGATKRCAVPTCTGITDAGQTQAVVSGSMFPVGITNVTCTATDAAGNPGTGTFAVRVLDTTPPVLTVADVHDVADPETATKLLASFPVSATDTVTVGPIPVGCTPKPGSVFVVGTTPVTCTARDGSGNETTKTLQVVISDGTAGKPCTDGSQCGGLACVDGVCCKTACGGGAANDCMACSKDAGGAVDGECGPVLAAAAHVCRGSAGSCDVQEVCDGTSTACPADAMKPMGTECRASGGACDVAETCDGATAACPADAKKAAGFECRASGGACDVAETCDGASNACPADAKKAAGFECRASGGACDVAETCDGSSNACPADAKKAPGTQCRASAGACDVAESCDGTSVACPADGFVAPGTQCRASAGVCDVAESCTGTSAACPPDAKKAPGTQCRASAGVCDVAESCDGTSVACPADGFVKQGTVCAAAGTCQNPGVCSGSNASCPAPTPIPGCCTDKTPPVFSGVPGTIIAYATTKDGATVTYTKPTATDAVDGVRTVTCSVSSGAPFKPGQTTITCTATDKCGNTATVTFTVWVQFKAPTDGTFFLPPIRSDGKSVFKIGMPVPVRFKLAGPSAGIKDLVAKLIVTKTSSNVLGTVDSTSDETVDDTDMLFKYRTLFGWYAYRWKTRDQTKGTFLLKADLGDGVLHQINVSLKP